MKILIKNVIRLQSDETGDSFKAVSGNIWIDGTRIVSLEKEPEGYKPDKIIDGKGKFAIPGLINAHTHAYMSLFRNYADDMAFWDWLSSVQSVEDGMTRADVYWGTLLNCIEMIKTGTTCFVDMNIKCAEEKFGEESGAAGAVLESGMRAFITRGLIGSVGEEYPDRQIREVLAERRSSRMKTASISGLARTPHTPAWPTICSGSPSWAKSTAWGRQSTCPKARAK